MKKKTKQPKSPVMSDDARRRQGAFFTPAIWVDEAHKTVTEVLGPNWKDECIVWDPAAGSGNLTKGYEFKDLIVSTLMKSNVETIRDQGYNKGASLFQYDFLNPGVWSPFFEEEDSNRIPSSVDKQLKEAAAAGKRLVFLMNPPYGTSGVKGAKGTSKKGIAKTTVNKSMKASKLGAPSQQLYAQFMYQCTKLAKQYGFEQHTIAMFSGATFVCSGSYRKFRNWWYDQYSFEKAFLFQASHFEGLSKNWGIFFSIWNEGTTDGTKVIPCSLKDISNCSIVEKGTKHLYNSDSREASKWVRKPLGKLKRVDAPQMSSGLKVKQKGDGKLPFSSLGFFVNDSNCIYQSAQFVFWISGSYSRGLRNGGSPVLPSNYRRCIALYAARKLVKGTWVNDKDEYLVPTVVEKGTPRPVLLNPSSLGYLASNSNSLMDSATLTFWLSSSSSHGHGLSVLPSNYRRCIALYAARKLVQKTWSTQKDEYLIPAETNPGYEQWVDDCHVYALLHNSNNCTSMRDVDYADKKWQISNHFFWVSRAAALEALDTSETGKLWKDCKENPAKYVVPKPEGSAIEPWEERGDPYLASIMDGLDLSPEAKEVVEKLSALWHQSLPQREAYAEQKPELHLLSWDAGVYQLKHLWRDEYPDEWKSLQSSFKLLAEKLRPGVYGYGFLLEG